ncbi:hypothetical protein XENOCAPTIV_010937, partial [Xenoophorus captivus]
AICDRQLIYSTTNGTIPTALVQALSAKASSLPDSHVDDSQFASLLITSLTMEELKKKQLEDQTLRHAIAFLETGDSPTPGLKEELPELPLLLRATPPGAPGWPTEEE